MTLIEFLLAQITEDEEAARLVRRGPEWFIADERRRGWGDGGQPQELVGGGKPLATFTDYDLMAIHHVIRHDPARVLADCDAKRRIVEHAAPLIAESERCADRDVPEIHDVALTAERILQLLALPYAEHPDYQPEWKPR